MEEQSRKRKREVRNELIENSMVSMKDSPTILACGLGVGSKKQKRVKRALSDTFNKNKLSPSLSKSTSGLKRTLQRKMSMSIRRQKLKTLQDYSLPETSTFPFPSRAPEFTRPPGRGLKRVTRSLTKLLHLDSRGSSSSSFNEDHDLQQKIDHEIKMRDGIAKLLIACKHPTQMLEAAKNLLTSNTRILSYMTELQQRKTDEVLGKNLMTKLGNQSPCKASLSISDVRIPLMWKDTDHFKNKGDYRRYSVFCLLKIGSEIYDTRMISNVDRSMTDISFDDIIVFNNIPHDFHCQVEVYCHKLHEDLTIASTPKKLRKKINSFSGSVGRSVGKRLSGLKDESDILGSMVLGPKFDKVASGTLRLCDIEDSISTYDFHVDTTYSDGGVTELPLFGHYCCRMAAVPACLVESAVDGYLSLQEDDELAKWKRYWCVLKNLQLACWSSPADVDVTQPLFTIAVTKNTQISDADPTICQHAHTFHLKTTHIAFTSEHSLACDTKDDLNRWWDGFQQHLLDQVFWKHTCENVMAIKKGTTRQQHMFFRKGSLYEETPIKERVARSKSTDVTNAMDESHLSKMLNTLMGEAKQIRGENSGDGVFL